MHSKSRKIAKYCSPSLKLKVNYWDSLGTISIKKKIKSKKEKLENCYCDNFIEISF